MCNRALEQHLGKVSEVSLDYEREARVEGKT